MSETYLDLPTRLGEDFPEIDNDIVMDLRDSSDEYSELHQQISDLKQQNPFITKLMQGSGMIWSGSNSTSGDIRTRWHI